MRSGLTSALFALTSSLRVKYTACLWRPWTAITSPSAPAAVRDPAWVPALPQPGHPSYPSGHSCLSGAATKVRAVWCVSLHEGAARRCCANVLALCACLTTLAQALELLTGSDATHVNVTSEGVPDAPGRVFTRCGRGWGRLTVRYRFGFSHAERGA